MKWSKAKLEAEAAAAAAAAQQEEKEETERNAEISKVKAILQTFELPGTGRVKRSDLSELAGALGRSDAVAEHLSHWMGANEDQRSTTVALKDVLLTVESIDQVAEC